MLRTEMGETRARVRVPMGVIGRHEQQRRALRLSVRTSSRAWFYICRTAFNLARFLFAGLTFRISQLVIESGETSIS